MLKFILANFQLDTPTEVVPYSDVALVDVHVLYESYCLYVCMFALVII